MREVFCFIFAGGIPVFVCTIYFLFLLVVGECIICLWRDTQLSRCPWLHYVLRSMLKVSRFCVNVLCKPQYQCYRLTDEVDSCTFPVTFNIVNLLISPHRFTYYLLSVGLLCAFWWFFSMLVHHGDWAILEWLLKKYSALQGLILLSFLHLILCTYILCFVCMLI